MLPRNFSDLSAVLHESHLMQPQPWATAQGANVIDGDASMPLLSGLLTTPALFSQLNGQTFPPMPTMIIPAREGIQADEPAGSYPGVGAGANSSAKLDCAQESTLSLAALAEETLKQDPQSGRLPYSFSFSQAGLSHMDLADLNEPVAGSGVTPAKV